MPIRNPFKRSPILNPEGSGATERGFRDATVIGADPTDIKGPIEVQLSEINDSGIFISPPLMEKPGFWQTRSNSSLDSSNHRSVFSDNEPFNMSRESFDSYRRSFDISARSAILSSDTDSLARRSIDSSLVLSFHERRKVDWPEDHDNDEGAAFEDVTLSEEAQKPVSTKKRGLFSRFGAELDDSAKQQQASGIHHGLFSGRKRAQSNQGAELATIPQSLQGIPSVVVVAD